MTDYTYNTRNPIGSTDVRDGVDNLKSFDVLLNSTDNTYQDRLGNTVPTAAGAIKRLGPVVAAWTFATGGTLNYPNEAALNPADGNYYGWTGTFPHVVAPGTNPTTVGSGYVPRTDVVLRSELTAAGSSIADIANQKSVLKGASGAGSIGFGQSTAASAMRRTVEYYGATGDGVANDTAATSAMIADVGYAAFKAKRYNLTGFAYSGQSLILIGERTPRYAGSGDFVDGTVLIGMNAHSVKDLHVERFGHKAAADGLVANSGISPTLPGRLFSRGVVGAGTGEAGSSHAILLQGFNHVDSDGFFVADAQYGAVIKSQGGCVGPIIGRNLRTAGLFAKGDTGAPAGGVANGIAADLQFSDVDVVNSSGNATCVAAFIQSSTDIASKIQISNVKSKYGRCGVEIAGGGTGPLQTNSIQVGYITSERPTGAGFIASGNPSDFSVGAVLAINPLSGKAVDTSSSCVNGRIEAMQVVVSDAAITSADCGTINGTQMSFGSLTVRNPARTMQLTANRSNVRIGEVIGNANITGDGAITLQNLATAVAGRTPSVVTKAGGILFLVGRVDMTPVTVVNSPVIGTLPFSVNADAIVSAAVQLAGGTYGATRLYVSGTSLQVLDANATNIDYLYLDGIAVQINQNAN